ncbi:MAG: hypothetical protein U0694_18285 [Anaerolineae bacterium]
MADKTQLQALYEQIKAGSRQAAAKQLVPLLRAEPDNAAAWWLLANASDNREYQLRALRQLAKLRPDDLKVRAVLAHVEDDPFFDIEQEVSAAASAKAGGKPPTLQQAVQLTWQQTTPQRKRRIYAGLAALVLLAVALYLFLPFLRRGAVNVTAPTPDRNYMALNHLDTYINYYGISDSRAAYQVLWQETGHDGFGNEYWCFITTAVELDLYGAGAISYDHFIIRLEDEDHFAPQIADSSAAAWDERGCHY